MTLHRMPTGNRHRSCVDHIPHTYPSSGWLCIGTDDPDRPAQMREFADHLVAVAARHRTLVRPAPIIEAPDGANGWRRGLPADVEGPTLAECDWSWSVLSCQMPIEAPAIETPAPVAAVRTRRARAVKPAGHPTAADEAPAEVSTGHIGYTWTIEGGLAEVLTIGGSVCRAPLSRPMVDGARAGREWWPVSETYEPMWRPLTWSTIAEAEADMGRSTAETAETVEPEPVEPIPAPIEPAPVALHVASVARRARHGRKRSDRAYVRGLEARSAFGRAVARILETFWLAIEKRRMIERDAMDDLDDAINALVRRGQDTAEREHALAEILLAGSPWER